MKLVIKRSVLRKLTKRCEILFNIFVIIGFYYFACAAGTSDYYTSTHQYYPDSLLTIQLIKGALFMLPRVIMFFVRGE